MNEHFLYINGKWCPQTDGRVTDDRNPADDTVMARVHQAGPNDVERTLASAQAAFPDWAATVAGKRETLLLKAADYLESISQEATEILISEGGSSWRKATSEVKGSVSVLRTAAGECCRMGGEVYAPALGGNFSFSIRQPLGVVLGIAPFNYPLIIAMKKVAYALAAGNTVVLKPASATPLTGLLIAKVFDAVGLPAGALNVIPCPGSLVGDKMVEDSRVKAISFTGSSLVGREIARKAAAHLKKYTMELGGKNPLILLADYDVDQAVKLAGYGAFFHQGQVCMATSRLIVEEPVYDEFCRKMTERARSLKIGDPHDHDTVIGPLIDRKQCEFIDRQIQDAVAKGARLLTGGRHEGAFYEPTVLADVTHEMDIFFEESFGPITSIIRARDSEDALTICNNSDYGLSAALLTYDMRKAMDMALRMESGKVHVNDSSLVISTITPSGGVKLSGCGKENGKYSIEEFSELKWITIQYQDVEPPC